jgi:hypothetical protein
MMKTFVMGASHAGPIVWFFVTPRESRQQAFQTGAPAAFVLTLRAAALRASVRISARLRSSSLTILLDSLQKPFMGSLANVLAEPPRKSPAKRPAHTLLPLRVLATGEGLWNS